MKKKIFIFAVFIIIFIINLQSNGFNEDCGDSCRVATEPTGYVCKEFSYWCGGQMHGIVSCVDPDFGTGKVLGPCTPWIGVE